MFETDFVRKLKVKEEFIEQLHALARKKGLKLYELQNEAMLQLIQKRRELQEEGKSLEYLVSPIDGAPFNVTLHSALAARIKRIADSDNCSDNRFFYTALVHYANVNGIIESYIP